MALVQELAQDRLSSTEIYFGTSYLTLGPGAISAWVWVRLDRVGWVLEGLHVLRELQFFVCVRLCLCLLKASIEKGVSGDERRFRWVGTRKGGSATYYLDREPAPRPTGDHSTGVDGFTTLRVRDGNSKLTGTISRHICLSVCKRGQTKELRQGRRCRHLENELIQ